MLNETIKQFLQFIENERLAEQLLNMTPNELIAYAHDNGFSITLESFASSMQDLESVFQSSPELSDTELKNVTGGSYDLDTIIKLQTDSNNSDAMRQLQENIAEALKQAQRNIT